MNFNDAPETWSDNVFKNGMNRLGIEVGERTWNLFRGVRWNAFGAAASKVFCGLATLFATRWLGPESYGEANLILATTFWIQVPIFIGIPTALMHYVPRATKEERESWVATALTLLFVSTTLTLVIAMGFKGRAATWTGVSVKEFQWGIVWCVGFALFTVATAIMSSYERFSARAKSQLGFALGFPILIIYFWISGKLNAPHYVLALSAAYGIIGFIGMLAFWPTQFFAPGYGDRVKKLLSYGLLASGGGIAGALFNAPGRLVVNKYLPIASVGILSAYQSGSVQMALFFLGPVTQVFFPIASRTPDRDVLFKKITRLMLLATPFLLIGYAGLIVFYISFLGKKYPLLLGNVFVFALASVFTTFYGVLSWFLASEGRRGLVVSATLGLLCGAVNLGGCHLLIPRWGIIGAALAYAVGTLAGIILCHCYIYATASIRSKTTK